MAPRTPAAVPLGTLNMNIQRAMLQEGSAQKRQWAGRGMGDEAVVTAPIVFAPQQQQQQAHSSSQQRSGHHQHQHHSHNNNSISNASSMAPTAASSSSAAHHHQHHHAAHAHADPFQDPSTVFRYASTRAQQQQQQTAYDASSYAHMFAGTTVDELFDDDAHDEGAAAPSASSLRSQSHRPAHSNQQQQQQQRSAFSSASQPRSILVRNGKYNNDDGHAPTSHSQSHSRSRPNSARQHRAAPAAGHPNDGLSGLVHGGGARSNVTTNANNSKDDKACAVEGYANGSYYGANNSSRSASAAARTRGAASATDAASAASSRAPSASATASSRRGRSANPITFIDATPRAHNQQQQQQQRPLQQQQQHPAYAARCASRSVAIPDDAPAMFIPHQQQQQPPTLANIFTPARQTYSLSTNNAHHQPPPKVSAATAANPPPAALRRRSVPANASGSAPLSSSSSTLGAASSSSCVRVGGAIVAKPPPSSSSASASFSAFTNGNGGGHRRDRTAAAFVPTVAEYNRKRSRSNPNGFSSAAKGGGAPMMTRDGEMPRGDSFYYPLSRDGSVASANDHHDDGCYYEDEDNKAPRRAGTYSQIHSQQSQQQNGLSQSSVSTTTNYSRRSSHRLSDGSDCFGEGTLTGAAGLPADLRALLESSEEESRMGMNNGSQQHQQSVNGSGRQHSTFAPSTTNQQQQMARRPSAAAVANAAAAADAAADPLLHAGFTAKPLWSLVGTFRTALQHAVDLRGGLAMRWVQRNPKGGHQRLSVPLSAVISDGTTIVRVEAPSPTDEARREAVAAAEAEQQRLAFLYSGRRDPLRNSRQQQRGGGRSSASRSRASSVSSSVGGADIAAAATVVQGNHTLPPYLRGKGGPRSLTASSSASSWAVVIRTVGVKPSQVTFGFGSALEAHQFKTRLTAVVRTAHEYM